MNDVTMLNGIRVLDLSRVLAGPFCTQILGDLGADVIKVEEPGRGDEVRTIAPYYPGGESHYFLSLNRNKRSVVIDLKSSQGRELLLDLVRCCDVVVENFRPGVLDRLGLSFDDMSAVNHDIILCSISGFGRDGALRDAPAFDLVAQARSGVMSVTGEPGEPPGKASLPLGDLGGGLWGVIAIQAALRRRDTADGPSGPQHIDLSLLDGLIALQGYLNQLALLTGQPPPQIGSDHHHVVPYGRFRCKDGYLVVAILVEGFWEKFCRAIGRPDLCHDERFASNTARRRNRTELTELIGEILCTRTRAEWEKILGDEDVPHGPVLDIVEALEQEQVSAHGLIGQFDHPTAGVVDVVGTPFRVDGARPTSRMRPPPLLGQHTTEVLTELLGRDEQELASLRRSGVVASGPDPTSP
ncbi:CaiB/BaiF CoA-transferase family protein [Pseudonocardia sp. KRD291]|uniref:CaiB/BaiF CoA transferase family protein n=1 Tax=Pseudonocardia sp. KRD291 TaxID=2792007 RepID=UPI001C49E58C|nr:CoA transferase [Pseudonocardia sp. KRD291]MBW0101025.1 CoA transferase [Pseudonocardia sp. KRD291]